MPVALLFVETIPAVRAHALQMTLCGICPKTARGFEKMKKLKDTFRKTFDDVSTKAEEGQAYAYGGGGLIVLVVVVVLLVLLLR